MQEPEGLDHLLATFCDQAKSSPNLWTDACLAAFARSSGLRLVTFDQGFTRFKGLERLVLKPVG